MAERKRNKEIHFYVTEEERKLILRKMIESKTKNMGAYLRKMAIDGYIVNTDTIIKSAGSVIAFAMKIGLPPVCQPAKKVKAIKRTWNIIVAPVGRPNYVLQLIRQSGLPSTMRNFYKKCS